ncbi:MAG TPA: hypothetical protein VJC11_00230, partial [Patescibacteria group bacterium]|nr:hypothetical protein [Patescibacteria group bacterium]
PYLIVTGFIVLVAALGFLIYFFFFASTGPTGNENVNGGDGGQFPSAGGNRNISITNDGTGLPNVNGVNRNGNENVNAGEVGNINAAVTPQVPSAVSASPALGGGVSNDGKGFAYYDKKTGKFYQTSEDGRRRTLSEQEFPDASNVVISPDANKAIVQFPDGSNIAYDFTKQQQYTLPKEGKDFAFNSGSDQLAYKFIAPDPENRYLVASGLDGSNFKLIEPLGSEDRDVQVTWSPTGQVAALFRKGVDADRQEVFFIGTQGENFKSMLVPGRDFKGEWSPQGDRLLYSVYTPDADFKPTLWIAEAQGDRIGLNRKEIGLETWVDKCTFDKAGVTAYCAVPQNLPRGAGLVRELADNIPDTMYKVDLRTGAKSPILNILGRFTAESVFLSDDGTTLFYTDKQTGFVYRVRL